MSKLYLTVLHHSVKSLWQDMHIEWAELLNEVSAEIGKGARPVKAVAELSGVMPLGQVGGFSLYF